MRATVMHGAGQPSARGRSMAHKGLNTACVHVGFFANNGMKGAQAEALRIPYADGTLFKLPAGEDDALMPSLLSFSDVIATGHHAAVVAKVAPKKAAVVGDGAVGLCGVIAAKRLGAEQTVIMGWHEDLVVLARESVPPTSSQSAARGRSRACASSRAGSARTLGSTATSRRPRLGIAHRRRRLARGSPRRHSDLPSPQVACRA